MPSLFLLIAEGMFYCSTTISRRFSYERIDTQGQIWNFR
jgi:hypothetical protein